MGGPYRSIAAPRPGRPPAAFRRLLRSAACRVRRAGRAWSRGGRRTGSGLGRVVVLLAAQLLFAAAQVGLPLAEEVLVVAACPCGQLAQEVRVVVRRELAVTCPGGTAGGMRGGRGLRCDLLRASGEEPGDRADRRE